MRQPAILSVSQVVEARLEERLNRFVVRARLNGRRVEAYLANTARLTDLLAPGAVLYLQASEDPRRKTRYTVIRFREGEILIGAEAAAATRAFDAYLRKHRQTPFGRIVKIEREVRVNRSRIDFRLMTAEGVRWWIEVKSLTRVVDSVAWFSSTPSSRGWHHLELLGRLASQGERAAAVFVVQRPDARCLRPGKATDPGWVSALRQAAAAGVQLFAFSCRVTLEEVSIDRQVDVDLNGGHRC